MADVLWRQNLSILTFSHCLQKPLGSLSKFEFSQKQGSGGRAWSSKGSLSGSLLSSSGIQKSNRKFSATSESVDVPGLRGQVEVCEEEFTTSVASQLHASAERPEGVELGDGLKKGERGIDAEEGTFDEGAVSTRAGLQGQTALSQKSPPALEWEGGRKLNDMSKRGIKKPRVSPAYRAEALRWSRAKSKTISPAAANGRWAGLKAGPGEGSSIVSGLNDGLRTKASGSSERLGPPAAVDSASNPRPTSVPPRLSKAAVPAGDRRLVEGQAAVDSSRWSYRSKRRADLSYLNVSGGRHVAVERDSNARAQREQGRLQGTELTTAIATEMSIPVLLDLVEEYRRELSEVQRCTAFHRVGKRAAKFGMVEKDRIRRDPRVVWLAGEVERGLPTFGPQALANVAWAHAQLGHGPPHFMQAVSKEALRQLSSFLPLEVSILMIAYGKTGVPCSELLSALVNSHVIGQLGAYNPRQIKEIAWAHAKQELVVPDLFREMAEHMEGRLEEFDMGNLATIAWAFAKLGHPAPRLFEAMANRVTANLASLLPQDVANFAWAYAKLEVNSPRLMSGLARQTVATVRGFCPQALSNTVWAFATLGHSDAALLEAVAEEAQRQMPRFSCQSLANTAWAFAALRHYSAPLLEAIARCAVPQLGRSEAGLLASLGYAFAVFGCRDEALLEALSDEVMVRLRGPGLHRQCLVTLAWALVVLRWHRLDVVPALRRKLAAIPDYSSQQLCQLYQVELALRLEAPQMGHVAAGWAPESSAGAYLECLWLTGYLREQAKACWDRENAVEKRQVSAFQRGVSEALTRMGIRHVCEHSDGEYSMDMAIIGAEGHPKIAVEADGPTHFAANERKRPLGPTLLKARLLDKLGWHVVQIPHFEWMELRTLSSQEEYLRERIGPIDFEATPLDEDFSGNESPARSGPAAHLPNFPAQIEPRLDHESGDGAGWTTPPAVGIPTAAEERGGGEFVQDTSAGTVESSEGAHARHEGGSGVGKDKSGGGGSDPSVSVGRDTVTERGGAEDGSEEEREGIASREGIEVRAERLRVLQARRSNDTDRLKMLREAAVRRSLARKSS